METVTLAFENVRLHQTIEESKNISYRLWRLNRFKESLIARVLALNSGPTRVLKTNND